MTVGTRIDRRRILVVEDSRTQAEALRSLLDEAGFDVEVAASGEAAIDKLRLEAVDLVISDVIMPGINGFELCTMLRQEETGGDTPFILLTSLRDPLDVVRGLECGADNYISKPFDPADLLARIERTFETSGLRGAAGAKGVIGITFLGRKFSIASGREQILDVLLSSFEDIVKANSALLEAEQARQTLFVQERRARVDADEARAKAEEANRTKSEFLAMMGHDLRTPLNAIGGYVELLTMGVRGPVTEAQVADLDRIQRNQRHLLALVTDILSFAKLESGEIPLELETAKLGTIAGSMESFIAPQAAARGITYEYLSCADIRVITDADRVQQILINLLGNALKFTPEGGRITMRCHLHGSHALVDVTDTGIGIPEGSLVTIFDPFVQVDANRGKREGIGLGLAISRKLAQALGGDIQVQSELGAGSTFTLSLPLAGEAE